MQVVFCRNVLIYFGRELRHRVLEKLCSAVCRGGYLCLGQSERLPEQGLGASFGAIEPETPIYRNRASA
jgi:chemotaxis protein methyltransferase CheR